jgi:hypothetical protein
MNNNYRLLDSCSTCKFKAFIKRDERDEYEYACNISDELFKYQRNSLERYIWVREHVVHANGICNDWESEL